MITLSLMLIVFLIGLGIFVIGLVCCLLSLWALFRQSDYDFVASRKEPSSNEKKSAPKKSSFRPAKNLRNRR